MASFGSNYTTPGWQRAQQRRGAGGFSETASRVMCRTACSMTRWRRHGSPLPEFLFTSSLAGEVGRRRRPGGGCFFRQIAPSVRSPHHRRQTGGQSSGAASTFASASACFTRNSQRQRHRRGRQQTDHSFRQGGREAASWIVSWRGCETSSALILRRAQCARLEGWGGHPISGLPEIGMFRAQVGYSQLAVVRDAALRDAPHHEAEIGHARKL